MPRLARRLRGLMNKVGSAACHVDYGHACARALYIHAQLRTGYRYTISAPRVSNFDASLTLGAHAH